MCCHNRSGDVFSLMGMVAGVTANFGPFCSKDFSSGVSSFLEKLITHLSWIHEEVEEVKAVLKVLVVLEAVLEDLEMRCLRFLIWVLLYCRNVFSLLMKIMFCRFVKVGSCSFYCRGVLVLHISVWRWLILIFVHLFLLWMSKHSTFFIMACSNLLPFHLISMFFGVNLFAKHLRLKILAVLDLASCISNYILFYSECVPEQ